MKVLLDFSVIAAKAIYLSNTTYLPQSVFSTLHAERAIEDAVEFTNRWVVNVH